MPTINHGSSIESSGSTINAVSKANGTHDAPQPRPIAAPRRIPVNHSFMRVFVSTSAYPSIKVFVV